MAKEEEVLDAEVNAHRNQEAVAAETLLAANAFTPTADAQNRTLRTGTRLRPDVKTNGRGVLAIENFSNKDAVARVVVSTTNSAVRTVYLQRGSKVELPGLREGAYRVLFTMGDDWDDTTKQFTECDGYYEFGKTLLFEEEILGDRIRYQRHEITLHTDATGTVPRVEVSRQKFLGG